ncbi:cysteine hydrolase [Litorivicinus sp.]|nr:cysteine hydrolase [Litorivicinus sp.]
MSKSNRRPADRVWERYIDEPFRSRVARQANAPQITEKSALIVIDLYNVVYQGGDRPVSALIDQFPASCGEHAYRAIEPTNRLIRLFRDRDLPVFFSTKDFERSQQSGNATHRPRNAPKPEDYEIYPAIDFRATDELVKKLKASVFFKTELHDHLKRLNVDSLVIVGESTSGCVRASVVDAFSLGYQVCVVEDCVFDQNPVSHAVNLYDIQHKYGQVAKRSELEADF